MSRPSAKLVSGGLEAAQTATGGKTNYYPELREIIKESGLLDKQLRYYAWKIGSSLAMLAGSIAFLFLVDNFWLQLGNAAFMAFVFGQIGYVGHDAGHRGVFRSARANEFIGLSVNFLISLSRTWWVTQHNQHHTAPNDLESDPHTMLPVLAFSQEEAERRQGLLRRVIGFQAFYFIPLLLLEGIGIRLASVQFLLKRRRARHLILEPGLMGLHFAIYFWMLFSVFTPWQVLAFALVHQGLFGLYYGLVFAPNHKGMLILDKNQPLDFLRTQVLTTRNVRPHPFTDFWFGGLNYQIEHHLFPVMPRNQLGKARKIIKEFCAQRGIPYYETSAAQSYREILSYLHWAAAPLRAKSAVGAPQSH